jgi:hypothetical protein
MAARVGRTEATNADHESPIERLELLAGDDEAIASFLDEIDVTSPREREMLVELARTSALARPERFDADHKRAIAALETLRRHGFHGSRAASAAGPLRIFVRWLVELVARYIVVSYTRTTSTALRNLYWLREMEAPDGSPEMKLLRAARFDAQVMMEIFKSREIGVPSFVFAGLLIPLGASLWRLADGFRFSSWWVALVVGLAGVAIGLALSWIVLRGTAMAGKRIRLAAREPVTAVWASVGNCASPPRDQSRKFAIVAIGLTVAGWIVLPALVTLSLAT